MVTVVKPKSKAKNITIGDGSYSATLSNVTQFNNAYGQRVGFEFTLGDGRKVMRSTNTVLTPKSKLAEVVTGLKGKPLSNTQLDRGIDLEKLIGTECMVLVVNSAGKNGITYSNVERIFQA
ncbi:MAG: hypothetical protein DRI65_08510 [Chloroflexota bacterium]|nr:MAG: hypothetical protein DRI65_08510 [Chloroflexota bacterium]